VGSNSGCVLFVRFEVVLVRYDRNYVIHHPRDPIHCVSKESRELSNSRASVKETMNIPCFVLFKSLVLLSEIMFITLSNYNSIGHK
jgi:hypothetical protein